MDVPALVVHIRASSALVLALEEIQQDRLLREMPAPEDASKRQPLALKLDVST